MMSTVQKYTDRELNSFSDEKLMKVFQSGHDRAYDLLVKRFEPRLHNFLYRYTKDRQDCEDLTQETFLRLWENKDKYRQIAKLSTWIMTIAVNLAKEAYRKKIRMETVSIHQDSDDDLAEDYNTELESVHPSPDKLFEDREDMEDAKKLLSELNEDFKETVTLADLYQFSYDEIADVTGTPLNTVKTRIYRGREKLQKLMKKRRRRTGQKRHRKKKPATDYRSLIDAVQKLEPGGNALALDFTSETELNAMRNTVKAYRRKTGDKVKSSCSRNKVYFYK